MSGTNVNAQDTMVRRLETELQECRIFTNGIIERANAGSRDLNEQEKALMKEKGDRMKSIGDDLEQLQEIQRVGIESSDRARIVDNAITTARGRAIPGEVEYRSAGAFVSDVYQAAMGRREASDRIETFLRTAEHVKTSDVPGAVPDPIIGKVLNFIDAARPIVSLLGAQPMPSETWHRPKVTQHTQVGLQGGAGLSANQKSELPSRKLVISKLNAQALSYGGYVNVARQILDFAQSGTLDLIINDLASEYSIETEAAAAEALEGVDTTPVEYDDISQAAVTAALWDAASQVFTAVRGQGRLALFIAPDRLKVFGPLFAPVNPQNAQGEGFLAAKFGQGIMGTISGIPTVMSAGLGAGKAFLTSSAAVEVYEQRVGTLQAVEPSVAGLQVGYLGYFAPLIVEEGGVVPLESAGS